MFVFTIRVRRSPFRVRRSGLRGLRRVSRGVLTFGAAAGARNEEPRTAKRIEHRTRTLNTNPEHGTRNEEPLFLFLFGVFIGVVETPNARIGRASGHAPAASTAGCRVRD